MKRITGAQKRVYMKLEQAKKAVKEGGWHKQPNAQTVYKRKKVRKHKITSYRQKTS